jgi:hypothetical protein
VKPGATGGDGTIGKPLGSLATALAKGGTIYVCAGTLSEKIALSSTQVAAKVYGGLDCATWRFADGAATKVVVANGPALAVTDAAAALLFSDVTFEAQAGNGSPAGQSRIAATASNAKALSFVRSTFVADPGEPGADGADGTPNGWAAGETGKGNPGKDTAPYAGAEKTCECTDGTSSTGGKGGALNLGGSPGASAPTVFDETGTFAGQGGTFSAANGCTAPSVVGGKNGKAGASGGAATTLGTLSASGWVSTDGTSAAPSNPGGGGGGGGGGDAVGGGGGGGGCGGCGGGPGTGGKGGGASIGFASIGATVSFTSCSFVVGAGGSGGKGGKGLAGGGGGGGGGTSGACSGGAGGNGAGGSGGGGGTGGISAGIAYTGAKPTVDAATKYTKPASAAKGGAGGAAGDKATTDTHVGNAGLAGGAGKDGEVADVFEVK